MIAVPLADTPASTFDIPLNRRRILLCSLTGALIGLVVFRASSQFADLRHQIASVCVLTLIAVLGWRTAGILLRCKSLAVFGNEGLKVPFLFKDTIPWEMVRACSLETRSYLAPTLKILLYPDAAKSFSILGWRQMTFRIHLFFAASINPDQAERACAGFIAYARAHRVNRHDLDLIDASDESIMRRFRAANVTSPRVAWIGQFFILAILLLVVVLELR